MRKASQNIIHRASFNFEYATAASAARSNVLIENMFNSHILPELQKAISNQIPEGLLIELSKLEINIGNINEKDIATNLAKRISSSLEDALKNTASFGKYDLLNGNDLENPNTGNLLLEILDIYFQKGYFLFGTDNSGSIDELVKTAIDNHRKEFIDILLKYQRHDSILKRVAFSLNPETFDLILFAFEPTHVQWIIDFRQILLDTRRKANLNQLSADEFTRTVNYLALRFFLNNAGSEFNKPKFTETILRELFSNFNIEVQRFAGTLKSTNEPLVALIRESLSIVDRKKPLLLPELVDQKLEINQLIEILNTGSSPDKTMTAELLKNSLILALRDTGKRRQLVEKLNKTGVRIIFELLSNHDSEKLFDLLSAFTTELIPAKSFNEMAMQTAAYLSQNAVRSLNTEEFVLFLLYAARLEVSKTAHSTSFRSFIQAQKNIDLKKIQTLLFDEDLNPEISDIQNLLLKTEIQPVVPNPEEYLIIPKRKIIGYFLYSGQLPDAYYDLSRHDLQTIFEELIDLKDDFLARQFHHSTDPVSLIERLNVLTANASADELEAYFIHYFKKEFDLLSKLIAHSRLHFPVGFSHQNNSQLSVEILISALAKSKGGRLPELFLLSVVEELSNSSGIDSDKFIHSLLSDSDIPRIGLLLNKGNTESEINEILERNFKQLAKALYSGGELNEPIQSIAFYFQIDDKSFLDYLEKNPQSLSLVHALFKSRVNERLWKRIEIALSSRSKLSHEFQKIQHQSANTFTKMEEAEFDLTKSFSHLNTSSTEDFRAFFTLLLNDAALLEKFSSSSKEIKFPLALGNKTAINQLNQLLAHQPGKIDGRFWKSIVLSFGVRTLFETDQFTPDEFAGSFLNHLLQKLKAVGKEELFHPILEQLKSSNSPELVSLAGFWQDEKVMILKASEDENQNPTKQSDQNLSILRFYAQNGFFPWWNSNISLPELISRLAQISRLHHAIFENSFLRLEKEEPILKLLSAKISESELVAFGQLFTNHPELHAVWKKINKKNIETVNLKHDEKANQWREIYDSSDEKILDNWFVSFPEIAHQIREYLSLSPYFYFRNINPGQWRKAVYQFSLDYYGRRPGKINNSFHVDFLSYLKQNYANVDWKRNLATVYELIHSSNPKVKAVFPEALIQLLTIETKSKAAEPILPIINEGDEVKIYNSGLILFWPFLTRLFEILSLAKNGAFLNPECRNRAVYILQYLAYNEFDFPEYTLVLNKLLSGMRPEEHLVPLADLTDEEKESAQSLINGLINNWEKVSNSSPQGIQETFIRRDGVLRFQEDKITLLVEKKGFDILMESIPWNIALVKLAWMEKPIYVEWI